ncbi:MULTISPECIES: hypothetical protein [unclassified Helicobacter]|uniref:hypothetical protein n=1 Tax=Helicobacter TaxID=209 RepID=UPI001C85BD30|nr:MULTISPECIES: hypothetical protein [unclassified Helicobacter]
MSIKNYLHKQIESTKDAEWEEKDIYNKLFTFLTAILNETGAPFLMCCQVEKMQKLMCFLNLIL